MSDSKAILDGLMERRGNSPEFILELEGYLDDLANGELDSADEKYIRDLAKRLGSVAEPPESIEDEDSFDDDKIAVIDNRFDRAKVAFHERFHPDNIDSNAPDAALRQEVYEEYWAELERIEDEG